MGAIDLHMHSIYSSDGDFTPGELMKKCKENGLRLVALTDHNSVKGVAEAVREGKKLGITVIPAVEFDCVCKGILLHLLAYGLDITSEKLASAEEEILQQEQKASRQRMDLIRGLGIAFSEELVWSLSWNEVVTGEMLGEAALADERNRENPLLTPYFPGGKRSDNPYVNFYWDFCSSGKAAYVPIIYPAFEKTQEFIQELGGISVIAHPGITVKKKEELIAYMAEKGVKGIEVYSSYHSPEQAVYYEKLAGKFDLIQTAGSDFHGKTKPAVRLGVMPGLQPPEEEKRLLKLLSEKNRGL